MMMILKNPVQGKHQNLLPGVVHQEVHPEGDNQEVHPEAAHLVVHLGAVHLAVHLGAVLPAVHLGAVLPAVHQEVVHLADHLRDQEGHLRQNHHPARNLDHQEGQKVGLLRDLNVALLDDEGYFWALKIYPNLVL